ncbi:hypothetical protein KUCAC02_029826 [Chaenocephalus aceratus]|uniref:Uncharacterized protein n=1 Tax=Chaenocephalus aceratus TaxID=36190 RepID=A0ACB9XJ52_CHAAC|nr:hypothetical protein KUCAC02_029826 [Chaenocephalus aceratus]
MESQTGQREHVSEKWMTQQENGDVGGEIPGQWSQLRGPPLAGGQRRDILFAGCIPRMTFISVGGFIFLGAYEKVRCTLL